MTEELLKELKIILREEFKLEVDDVEVIKYADSFVNYFGMLKDIYQDNLKKEDEE